MASVLIATDVFILVCCFIESVMVPQWMFVLTSVIFGGVIVFFAALKLRVQIKDGVITVRFLKRYVIPFGEVLDHKVDDIDIVRNFSGWGLKKVTFKNCICAGYEKGIALKVTGRKVIAISLSDPERFASLLPAPQSRL